MTPRIPAARSWFSSGVAGEHLAAIGGVVGGIAVAGTVAGTAGATTLLGSGALASALGGVFVTTTPVGWVVGSAALLGAAGYGIAKMIRSGSSQDQMRKEVILRLRQRLEVLEVLNTKKAVLTARQNLVDSSR